MFFKGFIVLLSIATIIVRIVVRIIVDYYNLDIYRIIVNYIKPIISTLEIYLVTEDELNITMEIIRFVCLQFSCEELHNLCILNYFSDEKNPLLIMNFFISDFSLY